MYLGSSSSNGVVKARIPKLELFLSSVVATYGAQASRSRCSKDVMKLVLQFLDPMGRRFEVKSVSQNEGSPEPSIAVRTSSPSLVSSEPTDNERTDDDATRNPSSIGIHHRARAAPVADYKSAAAGTDSPVRTDSSPTNTGPSNHGNHENAERGSLVQVPSKIKEFLNARVTAAVVGTWLLLCMLIDFRRTVLMVLLFLVVSIFGFGGFYLARMLQLF